MAGLYIHIPFCKCRCIYCDFYSSTCLADKQEYVRRVCEELKERKDYLQGQEVETIYFGGGTPSLLTAHDFEKIFMSLEDLSLGQKAKEISLEANPDDITPEYLKDLKSFPINRISLGTQSFDDNELKFLRRRHDAKAAINAVHLCQEYGFSNISIDLMYGLPMQSLSMWERSIKEALKLNIQHISAYHLIYEEDTPIFKMLDNKSINPVDEDLSLKMFNLLIDSLEAGGLMQYEISNFAKPGYESIHNSSYWQGVHYLGLGASAHSYNGTSRQWNMPKGKVWEYVPEIEHLDEKSVFNDFILTRLRTMKGIDIEELSSLFGDKLRDYCIKQADKHINAQTLHIVDQHIRLTRKGIFVSDNIMLDLIL